MQIHFLFLQAKALLHKMWYLGQLMPNWKLLTKNSCIYMHLLARDAWWHCYQILSTEYVQSFFKRDKWFLPLDFFHNIFNNIIDNIKLAFCGSKMIWSFLEENVLLLSWRNGFIGGIFNWNIILWNLGQYFDKNLKDLTWQNKRKYSWSFWHYFDIK